MKVESKQKKTKKKKIRVSRQWLAHPRTSLRMHNQACVRGQDYAFLGSCPETLKTAKTGKNLKTGILTT